jgi:hypothetical protein
MAIYCGTLLGSSSRSSQQGNDLCAVVKNQDVPRQYVLPQPVEESFLRVEQLIRQNEQAGLLVELAAGCAGQSFARFHSAAGQFPTPVEAMG